MKRAYCILFLIQLFIMPSYAQDTTYVDLGLSVKWATCNLGANSPEEYGDYYAWGETETKEKYDWSTYKWCEGDFGTLTKYCVNNPRELGKVDNKTLLEPSDEVAHIKLGGSWRMPTHEEQEELIHNCEGEWITINGIKGIELTSKINGNSIFLPAAGGYFFPDMGVMDQGITCIYWSSTLHPLGCTGAYALCRYADYYYDAVPNRCNGLPIRPVRE